MYSATYNWGNIEHFNFDRESLLAMKKDVPEALFLHPESQPGVLLQRRARDQVAVGEREARLPRRCPKALRTKNQSCNRHYLPGVAQGQFLGQLPRVIPWPGTRGSRTSGFDRHPPPVCGIFWHTFCARTLGVAPKKRQIVPSPTVSRSYVKKLGLRNGGESGIRSRRFSEYKGT